MVSRSASFRHRHGITRRLSLGPYPAVALAEAHFEHVEEFVQRYVLRQHKHPEQVQQMLDANVLLHWRRRRAQDITPRDVTLLLDRIVDRGSPIMANRVAATVSQMFVRRQLS